MLAKRGQWAVAAYDGQRNRMRNAAAIVGFQGSYVFY